MSKKTRTRTAEEADGQRFLETARQLGADESGEAFERAFGKIVPPKKPKPSPPEQTKKPRT